MSKDKIDRGTSGYAGTVTGVPVTLTKEKWQLIATFIEDNKDAIERDTPESEEEKAIGDLFDQLEAMQLKVIDIRKA